MLPLKINMEHNHGGLAQIIFLSKWVICRFQPLIFQCMLLTAGFWQGFGQRLLGVSFKRAQIGGSPSFFCSSRSPTKR